MSIEDAISYADVYENNLTDEHMQYLDALGVEWRGRNVFEMRDEVCIKAMQIFSQIYQQTALTNPAALPQLQAEMIQYVERVFDHASEDREGPSPLMYRFDPISGTHRELTAAEGFFGIIGRTARAVKFVLPPLPTPRNIATARAMSDRVMSPITRPIEKAEEKIAEWVEEHPVAATAIGVAVVVTLVIALGPAGAPASQAVIEAAAVAGAAAAATPSDRENKTLTSPKHVTHTQQPPKLIITYPPHSQTPPSYLEGVADRLKDVGRGADDVLQSSAKVLKESGAVLTHLLWKTAGIAGETLIGTTEILGSPLYIPERNQLVRDVWAQEVVPSIHEKIDHAFSTNSRSDFDRRNDSAFKQGLDSFMLNPLTALGGPIAINVDKAASGLAQEAVAVSTALGKTSSAGNTARTSSVVSQALRGEQAAQEIATVKTVEGISVVEKIASPEAQVLTALAKGEGSISVEVVQLEKKLSEWLGEGTKLLRNEAGDPILLSKDGLRKVRFDFKNPEPHEFPHMHLEQKINNKWEDVVGSEGIPQIYPKDVPHR